jgi:hypothetical protein
MGPDMTMATEPLPFVWRVTLKAPPGRDLRVEVGDYYEGAAYPVTEVGLQMVGAGLHVLNVDEVQRRMLTRLVLSMLGLDVDEPGGGQ